MAPFTRKLFWTAQWSFHDYSSLKDRFHLWLRFYCLLLDHNWRVFFPLKVPFFKIQEGNCLQNILIFKTIDTSLWAILQAYHLLYLILGSPILFSLHKPFRTFGISAARSKPHFLSWVQPQFVRKSAPLLLLCMHQAPIHLTQYLFSFSNLISQYPRDIHFTLQYLDQNHWICVHIYLNISINPTFGYPLQLCPCFCHHICLLVIKMCNSPNHNILMSSKDCPSPLGSRLPLEHPSEFNLSPPLLGQMHLVANSNYFR